MWPPAFVEFVGDAKLVIHNAAFDMKFLNAELSWISHRTLPMDQAIDTLEIARRKYPGAQNSLDALCRRFNVDNSIREKHGALLDAELLAEVYLELVGGRQPDFMLGADANRDIKVDSGSAGSWKPAPRPTPLPSRLSDEERARHEAFVGDLGDSALWKKLAE